MVIEEGRNISQMLGFRGENMRWQRAMSEAGAIGAHTWTEAHMASSLDLATRWQKAIHELAQTALSMPPQLDLVERLMCNASPNVLACAAPHWIFLSIQLAIDLHWQYNILDH